MAETKVIRDVLHYVASTAGIKLKSEPNKYLNPSDEDEETFLTNIDELKGMQGKEVSVALNKDGKYIYVELSPSVPKEIEEVNMSASFNGANEVKEESKSNGLKKEHIIKLQGKEFITHAGLLEVAHDNGLEGIETEAITVTDELVLFKASVTMKGGKVFTGHGDTTLINVNSMIKNHKIRMAETRAVNRALRFATNIGMCSADELGGEEPKKDGN